MFHVLAASVRKDGKCLEKQFSRVGSSNCALCVQIGREGSLNTWTPPPTIIITREHIFLPRLGPLRK